MTNKALEKMRHHHGLIQSTKGGWRIGEAVYNHGFNMLEELVGEVSYFQLVLLNVTGELKSKQLCDWLEASYICMSWPDPRIWCNYIGALSGASRTTPAAGILAGTLASDSKMYGPGSLPNCMKFLKGLKSNLSSGMNFEEVIRLNRDSNDGKINIPGFSRPIAKGDERVGAMQRVGKNLGFTKGSFEILALEFETHLKNNHDESINIGGYTSAFLLDQGFTPETVYEFTSTRVTAGVQACYSEYANKAKADFLPLSIEDIAYTGQPVRQLPTKKALK
ncbi:MAG: hypothetical protein GJ680_03395 [Alteromonadaceae bacterium]|nr:hypothetical protein [Alteromonadaceae bacterium]